MESLEISAKTVDEAVKLALARLGREKDEVLISVLSEGSRGILGIGGEDARILVTPIGGEDDEELEEDAQPLVAEDSVINAGREVLQHLLDNMNIDAEIEVRAPVPDADGQLAPAVLDIRGDDLGLLIGRRGETLSSLQFLTNLILSRKLQRPARLGVDVESYRLRREQSLRGMAARMAERVKSTRQSVMLEAMPPHERRIIHVALSEDPEVVTQSTGEDAERRVVILPKR